MRVTLHEATTSPALGDPLEPRTNQVSLQVSAFGDGAVTATVQPKGRIDPQAPLVAIGDPISLSGTASEGVPVTATATLTSLGAAELYADLTACSLVSFRAVAWEAGR
jgi:hypothetical protein